MPDTITLGRGGWRYLVPNGLTAANIVFGTLSCFFSASGNTYVAGWLVLLAVCFDRLDGAAARALGASGRFGVEFDSLADLVSFGIAPAVLVFCAMTQEPALGYGAGWRRVALLGCCSFYVLACAFRLARFNVFTGADATKIFFGLPSPASAATLVNSYLITAKYSGVKGAYSGWAADVRVFGGLELGSGLRAWFPVVPLIVSLMMVSGLKVPKLNPGRSAWGIYLGINMSLIYVCVLLRVFPEYLLFLAIQVIVISFVFHFFRSEARDLTTRSVWEAMVMQQEPAASKDSASDADASE